MNEITAQAVREVEAAIRDVRDQGLPMDEKLKDLLERVDFLLDVVVGAEASGDPC